MGATANPHDAQIRLCWKACRYGAARVREPEARAKVLARLERLRPQFAGSPVLDGWARIVAGEEPAALRELETVRDLFELPIERRSFWRPLIQSQPFTCVVPGRTTRERRAVLSRLP